MSISSTLTAPRPLVLLVDDTQSVLRLLERSLEEHDFDILTAMDGGEALVVASGSQRRVDLAVLDLTLPDMAGEDLAAELRLGQPELRVLFTAGYLSRQESTQLGDPVLRKPFGPHELARHLRAMLPTRRRAGRPSDEQRQGPQGPTTSSTTLAYRVQVRPEFRAAYPGVPAGWLRAHRRATDKGAFWLDADKAGGPLPSFPILEPHVELETIAYRSPRSSLADEPQDRRPRDRGY